MIQFWNVLLYQPLVNALIFLYQVLFNNLGLAIIALTVLLRAVLIPLTLPGMKATQKMKELAPQLAKLKKKYGKDKQGYAKAQMELYKQHGANPAAGCLPQIVQLIILIALYQAFRQVLSSDGEIINRLNEILYSSLQLPAKTVINTQFLYFDLAKPDIFPLPNNLLKGIIPGIPGVLLIAAALVQFLSSKLMTPAVKRAEKEAKKTPQQADDMAASMQKQMLYLFPLMTIVIGFSFPAGLVLYWFVFSAFTAIQQYIINVRYQKKD